MNKIVRTKEENSIETIDEFVEEQNLLDDKLLNDKELDIHYALRESDEDEKMGRISRKMTVEEFWIEINKGDDGI
jgi:hypothetical protein